MFFRFILFSVLFYFLFKIIRQVMKLVLSSKSAEQKNSFTKTEQKKKFDIKKEDIVDADFEEIRNEESNSN